MIFSGLTIYITALVFLISAVVLFCCHFLHTRRRRITVAGLYFWSQVSGGVKYNKISGKFYNIRTFLFLILILIFYCITLLHPVITRGINQNYIFVFDTRDTMGEIIPGKGISRLDKAKLDCYDLLENIDHYDQITIISYSDTVDIYTEQSGNKNLVLNNIAQLKIGKNSGDSSCIYALATAKSIVGSMPETQVFVFSDKGLGIAGDIDDYGGFYVLNPIETNFNIAILDVKIITSEELAIDKAMLSLVCFGPDEQEYNFTVKLFDGNQEVLSFPEKMKSGTYQTFAYTIPTGLHEPVFRLLSKDLFPGDNTLEDATCNVNYYSEIELPVSLKLYLDSDIRFKSVKTKTNADILITADDADETHSRIVVKPYETAESYSKATPAMGFDSPGYSNEYDNIFIKSTDGFSCDISVWPYLLHANGQYLAAKSKIGKIENLYISGALFDLESSFWKQSSYIKFMNYMISDTFSELAGKSNADMLLDTYEISTNTEKIKDSNIFKSKHKSLYGIFSLLVISLLLLESVLYQREVIE